MTSSGNQGVGDDLFQQNVGGLTGLHEKSKRKEAKKVGNGGLRSLHDPRKLRFDIYAAQGGGSIPWRVDKSDRMSAREAGDKMLEIMKSFGLAREEPEIIYAFQSAMFYSVAINSSSVLMQDRTDFYVLDTKFSLFDIVRKLNVDARRFFRAYADEIRMVVKQVLADVATDDYDAIERRELVMAVATDRGLFRYPDLVADVSDACSGLEPTERVAIANSKVSVLRTRFDAADRLTANARTFSAENYDSTNAEIVQKQ